MHYKMLIWIHIVLPHCTHAIDLMSHAIPKPFVEDVDVDNRPFWKFGMVTTSVSNCPYRRLPYCIYDKL